ncbi:MAG TPA: hypothetical protein VFP97_07640 [Chitinophagaceae bacterium]|nr:hypothetical protein [Chitinophagaceae bacterium]
MKKICVPLLALCVLPFGAFSQLTTSSRLKVFTDCSSTWCDMQFIRSEINSVDFLLDNLAADVHILITSQRTGSGGNQYQLSFFGQQGFKQLADTLRFATDPNATEFEQRNLLLKYLKAGLVPFIIRTKSAIRIDINLKTFDTTLTPNSRDTNTRDPWQGWVMRLGADGNIHADANYKNKSYNLSFSANKIIEKIKIGMGVNRNRNRSIFQYDDNGTIQNFVVNNHSWSANQYVVKSINSHWSWAYEIKYSQNTFANNKGRVSLRGAVEYNIFPYSDVNNKLLTLSYGFTARRNNYYDSSIYDRTRETLYGHRATAYLSLNQKWGNSYAGITYHNYFHNWKLFNLGVDIYSSIRVTGGLSVFVFGFGGLTRDQVFLVKGDATPEEVLARRRQLASGYNYFSSVGLNYRFGSKLNNVVNPRFDRSSSLSDD